MKRLVNKLRSESGATILFAILVFMLCALVGAAALTAAAANSGRYTHIKAEQQEYLSMSSAVNLMRDQLVGKTFTAQVKTKKEVTTLYTAGVAGTPTETTELEPGSPVYEYDGGFSTQLLNVFTEFFLNKFSSSYPDIATAIRLDAGSTAPYTDTLTISLDGDADVHPVTANLTVDENFNITVEFFFENSGVASNTYKTKMTIRATMDGDGINTSSTSSTTSEYDGGTLKSTTTTTVTTYTMKVTWLEANTTVVKSTLETEGA